MKKYLAALSVGVAPIALISQVISGDAVLYPIIDPFSEGQMLYLTESLSDETGGGLFAIWITPLSSPQYEFGSFGISEEYALFSSSIGEKLNPDYVNSRIPIVTNYGIDPVTSIINFEIGENKVFGYWDDRNYDGIADSADNYGWMTLERPAGTDLVLTDSATAIGGGIIIGTTTQIPEPGEFSALMAAFALLTLARRRRKAR